mmetsp:Transcript_36864/g.80587  ORF Transcript_36864/g.80587 Transcript_36864/m.80587 type:complete len:148 (+) Transcript_36864:31-474(+)|eukprot:CAMPEP_0204274196 /NCGR_PEP_ID=MMETSP0468-20130131/25049_1 /ASSEMBLY_ACC=CAM_ASM_000383 /TAXON_ID=2969 /ORGANISM="Oxyrrhis marina" /LENGTH=147 /DNA_ID=CAMNT_0051250371 /DNA_START=30 /DNA_END=473 /DNA_ORIENTATION=-
MDLLSQARILGPAGETQAVAGKVLLYFSAGWCPDCVAFGPEITKAHGELKDQVTVVYVPSETAQEEVTKAHTDNNWGAWPTVAVGDPAVAGLKKLFGVCANKEMQGLGLTERKAGLPGLVLLGAGGEVLCGPVDGSGEALEQVKQKL